MQSRFSLLKRSSLAALLVLSGAPLVTQVAEGADYRDPNNLPPHVRSYYNNSRNQYYNSYDRPTYNSRYYTRSPYAGNGAQQYTGRSWWRHDVIGGAPRIVIDLSEQTAYFYKGGKLAGVSPVSTGKAGHRTPTGNFRISEKKYNHRSNLYGHYVSRNGYVLRSNVDVRRDRRPPGSIFRGASMDFMMRINGAVTMHAGYVPGYPASHGCIRLPWHMAKIFFSNATVGTKVSVVH
ncbi:L,D-transpeptidase family protein [Microbulbifer marinus]|uniref:L,D-transpeptidase catalytic domain n=1 Tax=Microbulbifer marinus TaxID=658218 RepID=A0A1H3YAS9_9GAMM|nr:L,D-transpeptidase family protein [Microbulbifer marinus]SEA08747.1 L,D-transpeptidase catalytic domain [Microbulbifer marinus]